MTFRESWSPVTVLPLLPGLLGPHPLLLLSDLECLGAVVLDPLGEPGVVESLLGCNPLRWIIHEDPLEEVEELQIELVVRRDGVLNGGCQQRSDREKIEGIITCSRFIALTYFREALGVSVLG